jgi:predicted acetyltransferase
MVSVTWPEIALANKLKEKILEEETSKEEEIMTLNATIAKSSDIWPEIAQKNKHLKNVSLVTSKDTFLEIVLKEETKKPVSNVTNATRMVILQEIVQVRI